MLNKMLRKISASEILLVLSYKGKKYDYNEYLTIYTFNFMARRRIIRRLALLICFHITNFTFVNTNILLDHEINQRGTLGSTESIIRQRPVVIYDGSEVCG
jgi:hypothetical protein